MLGQSFPVVLGQHAGRPAVDEPVQTGRPPYSFLETQIAFPTMWISSAVQS